MKLLTIILVTVLSAGCARLNPYVGAAMIASDADSVEIPASNLPRDGIGTQQRLATAVNSGGPFAKVSLGVEIELTPSVIADLQAAHQSSVETGRDRGENTASLSVRWYWLRR